MKQNILEHIIRTIFTEQSSEVKLGKKWKVRTFFKRDLGSPSDDRDAMEAGSVFGFRIKAISKNATEDQISNSINDTINNDPQLQKYLNGNYMFIRSDEQRDSYKNRLYNYWVIPKAYAQDKMWVYNNKVKQGDESTYNTQIGLPASITDIARASLPRLYRNTPHHAVSAIISNVNLRPKENVIDYPFIDIKRYEAAYKWLKQLKYINKKVKTADLQTPEEYSKKIATQTIYRFTKEDALPVELNKKSIFASYYKNPIVFFAGNYDIKNSVPLDGEVSVNNDWAISEYIGTFTATKDKVTVTPIMRDNNPQLPDVVTSIPLIDFKDGGATNYSIKIKNFTDQDSNDLKLYRYTGPVKNGQLASDSIGAEGQLEDTSTNTFYRGTFKQNNIWDGVIWRVAAGQPKFLNKVISGQLVPYSTYNGDVYQVSDENLKLALNSELKNIFKQFVQIFKPEEFVDPNDITKLQNFVNMSTNPDWNLDVIQILHDMLLVWFGFNEIETKSNKLVTQKVHKWILDNQNDNSIKKP